MTADAEHTARAWPAAQVEMWQVADLVPYARNARQHPAEQIDPGSHGDDVAEQSASVEVTEATLERRQTKAISESAGQPNEESAD